ncbi:hypothetical protein BDN72DRAFT_849122 [Pluteus cervinus]|uniref:Uncharacterized protein n=1 Tax=Pluteus cervinus TaxID=181527 RepID=A0ACD3A860_9AGAR|nr:hypothetical protein BDN72DRAFT_849122 [Pluteus cervinus]
MNGFRATTTSRFAIRERWEEGRRLWTTRFLAQKELTLWYVHPGCSVIGYSAGTFPSLLFLRRLV